MSAAAAAAAAAANLSRSRTRAGTSETPRGVVGGELSSQLEENLKIFMKDSFYPDAYVQYKWWQTMKEKEIRHLCSLPLDVKKASAEKMQRNVYTNYPYEPPTKYQT